MAKPSESAVEAASSAACLSVLMSMMRAMPCLTFRSGSP
jgi:hypothetical protein